MNQVDSEWVAAVLILIAMFIATMMTIFSDDKITARLALVACFVGLVFLLLIVF